MSKIWTPVYDGTDGGDAGDGGGNAAAAAANATAASGAGTAKTFTEEQVNKIVQERLGRDRGNRQEIINQLETLRKDHQLTEEQRDALQAQIDNLQSTMMTKEELAAKERKKLESKFQEDLKVQSEAAKQWRGRYEESTITRSLTDAAVVAEAFRPSQIVEILRNKTRLAEELDADGKPTGNYIPTVKLTVIGKDSKPVTLDLTVEAALKQMKELTDEYGNLFKSGANSGVGGQNNAGGNRIGSINLKDTSSYIKARQAGTLKLDQVRS